MGEQSAAYERLLSDSSSNSSYTLLIAMHDHLPINENIVCLDSFPADKLKYVQHYAVGYNKCKLYSTHGAALMSKSATGEKNA